MEIDDAELKSACEHLGADFEILRGKKCPYCKGETKYVDSSLVYGRSYGMMYLCEPCDAYVGVHHKTSKESLGSVAKGELRNWRKQAHAAFDPIAYERRKNWNRREAYSWLRKKMGIPKALCHIGMFSVNRCKKVIEICKKTPWNE